jgi:chromosome partitioning protein
MMHQNSLHSSRVRERRIAGKLDMDWIVLRNRLSTLTSRNKHFVDDALLDLSQELGFRCGLTAIDELDESTLGTRPTMSHLTAQLEAQNLLAEILDIPRENTDAVPHADAA